MSELNPQNTDAILGGQNSPPVNAAILGGLAGVKQRLDSESIAERLQALNNAVTYGEDGIDLAMRSLSDNEDKVRRLAKRLLRDRFDEAGKEALLECDPMSYFVRINDWKEEIYNPEIGIVDPANNSYVLNISGNYQQYSSNKNWLELLAKESQLGQLKSLIIAKCWSFISDSEYEDNYLDCYVGDDYDDDGNYCGDYNENAKNLLWDICSFIDSNKLLIQHLKALYIGSRDYYAQWGHGSRFLIIDDPTPLLKSLPNLEILHIQGNFSYSYLKHRGFKHNNLTCLVIDSTESPQEVESLFPIDMPNLEYFEIWLDGLYDVFEIISAMQPILSKNATPRLKYLGLCNSTCADELIQLLFKFTFVEQLAVLDLRMGTISDCSVEHLWKFAMISSNLKLLNVSHNCLSPLAIEKLKKLPCKVKFDNQYLSTSDRNYRHNYVRSY
jgi:hypothetical protein